MPTMRIVLRGKVQGVGMRDYARRIAERDAIKGEVWNRVDDTVEIIAQHEDPAVLEAFREEIRFGPGRVDSLSDEPYDPAPDYDAFQITFLS